jgi:putative membrane protein
VPEMMIFFWALIIIGLVYLFKTKGYEFDLSKKNEAEEILKKRYVNGEIDEETYNRIRNGLKE